MEYKVPQCKPKLTKQDQQNIFMKVGRMHFDRSITLES